MTKEREYSATGKFKVFAILFSLASPFALLGEEASPSAGTPTLNTLRWHISAYRQRKDEDIIEDAKLVEKITSDPNLKKDCSTLSDGANIYADLGKIFREGNSGQYGGKTIEKDFLKAAKYFEKGIVEFEIPQEEQCRFPKGKGSCRFWLADMWIKKEGGKEVAQIAKRYCDEVKSALEKDLARPRKQGGAQQRWCAAVQVLRNAISAGDPQKIKLARAVLKNIGDEITQEVGAIQAARLEQTCLP